jgi:hypothetical protein
MNKLGVVLIVAAVMIFSNPAFAEEMNFANQEDDSDRDLAKPRHDHRHFQLPEWAGMVSIYGIVDTRIEYRNVSPETDGFDEEAISDIYVYNAGLGVEVNPNEFVSGNLFFLWEEDFGGEDLGVDMDEGYITLAWKGLFMEVGKHYLPVGQFDTFAVSDPLVLEVAESRQTNMGLGYNHRYFEISGWVFAGGFDNVNQDGRASDNMIDAFAARLDVMALAFQENFTLTLGGYFLSDATETSLEFGGNLAEVDPDGTPESGDEFVVYESDVPLYGGFLTAELPFMEKFGLGITGEYVTTGKFEKEEYVDNAGEATAIAALNAELALLVLHNTIQLGPKFEMISGLDWLDTQDNKSNYKVTSYSQFGGFAGYDPWDNLHVGTQVQSGFDNEGNRVTDVLFQIALEF